MKRIPQNYWQENYGTEIPSPLQIAWVQRWLELLDANTSYYFSLNPINLPLLVEDILSLDIEKEGNRTYSRLMFELESHLDNKLLNNNTSFAPPTSFQEIHQLFEKYGSNKHGIKDGDPRREKFKLCMKNMVSKSDPALSDLLEQLKGVKPLGNGKTISYRNYLCETLYVHLLGKLDSGEWYQQFALVDMLTQTLITELIAQGGYSFLYLTNLCVDTFLRENQSLSFEKRAKQFFDELSQVDTKSTLVFTVYLRIQAKRALREINQFRHIRFCSTLDNIGDKTVKDVFSPNDNIDDKMVKDVFPPESLQQQIEQAKQLEHAKRFFFVDDEPSKQLIFAVISNVLANDHFGAAAIGLENVTEAVQQAKFEYELHGFNIDKCLYVYSHQTGKLISMSRKELTPSRYGTVGNVERLKKLLTKLDMIDNAWRNKLNSKKEIEIKKQLVEKLRGVALSWHQAALESDTKESRFLHHWIGLEQLFTLIEIDKKSTSDKLVSCVNEVLCKHWRTQIVNDLWGDISRSKILTSINGSYAHLPDENAALQYIFRETLLSPIVDLVEELCILDKKLHDLHKKLTTNKSTESWDFKEQEKSGILESLKKLLGVFDEHINKVWVLNENSTLDQNFASDKDQEKLHSLTHQLYPLFKLQQKLVDENFVFSVHEELWIFDRNLTLDKNIDRLSLLIHQLRNSLEFNMHKESLTKLRTELKHLNFSPETICKLLQILPLDTYIIEHILRDKTKLLSNSLAKLCYSQPLLEYRIIEIAELLKTDTSPYFIADLDRMRRTRNMLMHQAIPPKYLELLTQRLYKYSRVYLREIIHGLAKESPKSINAIMRGI